MAHKDDRAKEERDAIIAKNNSEKAKKDMQLKVSDELSKHISDQKAEIVNLSREMETKQKALSHLDNEIKAKTFELEKQTSNFVSRQAKRADEIDRKQKEVDSADLQYKALLAEVHNKKKALESDAQKIEDERRAHKAEMGRLKTHVHDIEAELSRKNADILDRENKLVEAKKAFEAEKAALEPELRRISEIKNENEALYRKIEADKTAFENRIAAFDSYKERLNGEVAAEKAKIQKQADAFKNKELSLREWEQNIKDFELEVKAREAEAQKAMKRYQLHQSLKDNKD